MKRISIKGREKGITLIALVITIIILLILAAVTIATLTGDNGILSNAVKAKEETEIANEKEQIGIASASSIADNEGGNLTKEDMENNLIDRQGNDATVTDEGQNLRVVFNNSKREYLVNKESGNIEISDETIAERSMKLVVNSGEDGYVVLPISIYENCTIDWGDGTVGGIEYSKVKTLEIASTTPIKISAFLAGYEHKYNEYNQDYTVTISGEVAILDGRAQGEVGGKGAEDSLIRITQWGNTNLDTIYLAGCNKLIEIASPNEGSFDNLQYVESAFKETGITEIPDKFFYGCTKIESFANTFASCPNLTSVGDNIFGNCINAQSFEVTFGNCSNLKTVGDNIFGNCINAQSFELTFGECSNLTTIGNNIFENCTNAKSFYCCFMMCSSLTNIDEHIFDDCQKVENFSGTFVYCTNLEGNAIPLWERNPVPNGVGCYAGCTKITGDIPDDWKTDPYA